MQAQEFIRKWSPGSPAHELNERAGARAHFIDLCRSLGVPEPGDPETYCFERGVAKTGGAVARTDGFADVWLRGHFAWEYKAPGRSLELALKQLMMYALPLENPPLLVVSDRQRIEIHTHFTGRPSEKHVLLLEDFGRPEVQESIAHHYLEFAEALEQLLGRRVDLLPNQPIRNPYLRKAIDASRCELYVRATAEAP